MRARFASLVAVAALAGCGEDDPAPQARATSTPSPAVSIATATPASRTPAYHQRRGCYRAGGELRFCRREGAYGALRTAAGPLRVQRPRGTPPNVGGWIWAAASPEGRTILMQWSGECEIPTAYLVPASGGRPRPAVDEASNSMGLGWTTDGRAIVFMAAEPGCGSAPDAGLFLVAPGGKRERVGPAAQEPPFPARVRPRDATRLRAG